MEVKSVKSAHLNGIYIPANVWLCESLSITQKCFVAEIDRLHSVGQGCVETNAYFSKFFQLTPKRVSSIINDLAKIKVISSEIRKECGNKRVIVVNHDVLASLIASESINALSPKTGIPYPRKSGEVSPETGIAIPENRDTLSPKIGIGILIKRYSYPQKQGYPIPENEDSASNYKEIYYNYNTNTYTVLSECISYINKNTNTLPQNFSNFEGFSENSFFSANSEELGQSQQKETTSSNLSAKKQQEEPIATFSQKQEIEQVATGLVAKTENTVENANFSQKPKKEKQAKEPKPKKDKPTRLLWKEYVAGYESFARAAMNGGPIGSLSGKDIKHLADIYDYFTELVIHAGLTNNKVANTDAMTLAEKKAIVAGFGLTEQVLAERVLLGFERMEKHLKDKFANGKPVIPDFVRNNPTPSNIFSQRMAIKKAIDEFKSKGGAKTPADYQNRSTAANFGLNQSSMPEYYGEHDSNLDPLPPDAAQMISRVSANAAMKIVQKRGL